MSGRASAAKTLPDFLVIGAAKSGTTALHQYLEEHPEIFMCAKEARYLAYDDGPDARMREQKFGKNHFWVKTLEDYQALFAEANPAQVWGEAAPIYLESELAPHRILELIPAAKLIACLRNPVDRAFSGYVMQVRAGREHRSADAALHDNAHSIRASFYYPQIKRYFDLFPRESLRVYLFEEFRRNNAGVLSDIFEFLGVDPSFRPDTNKKHNVSSFPKSRLFNAVIENRFTREVLRPKMPRALRGLARGAKEYNLGKVPEMTPETQARLQALFRDDILRLQDLTGLDLSSWLAPAESKDRATAG